MIVDALRYEDVLQCLRNQSSIQSNAIPIILCIATLVYMFSDCASKIRAKALPEDPNFPTS
jgi:hypothetical protein